MGSKPLARDDRHTLPAPVRIPVLAFCIVLTAVLLASCASERPSFQRVPQEGYFDPHNHLSGVLPWQAYADLPAYIRKLEGQGKGVTRADKLGFYTWLADEWYATHRKDFGDKPFSAHLRYGLGARAALELHPPRPDMNPDVLDHVLERIFTATPYTEFDSAYAFHGPAYTWLAGTFYKGNRVAGQNALCKAQILTLADTGITRSEQSISFIGGWNFNAQGQSHTLQTVRCAAREPQQMATTLKRLHEPVPKVRIILMTHTDQLGENADGKEYQTFDRTGQCHREALPGGLKLSPQQMQYALLGKDKQGKLIIAPGRRKAFFDTLAGIDTAGPEMTCFSDAGMAYYRKLVDAVYRAAKARRALGWQGKLLVHTHVGEGFGEYYASRPPKKPWTFASVFARVPALDGNIVTNRVAPHDNISMLLNAVAKVRQSHPDLDQYVVIRFGHLTHAGLQQAREMARLHIEADVNLDSNLATGAWSFAEMPDVAHIAQRVEKTAANPKTNYKLNDLPGFLIPDPNDADAVADVLGTHPLKYLLMAHVRVMLGTDGAGVEHSSMPREYALAASLIRYWKDHDPKFDQDAGNVSRQTFYRNATWHLANMAGDVVKPYAAPN